MEWLFDNDRPIYIQLVEQLKVAIASGIYKSGEKLPSVRDFALEMKVNPNTVQRALVDLENSKLVYTERTSGKFVTQDKNLLDNIKKEIANKNFTQFINNMRKLGFASEEIKTYIQKNQDII